MQHEGFVHSKKHSIACAVAIVQGALGGLAFWLLDINGAWLWAVLMILLSLLPAVGTALVWLPVAVI